MSPRPRSVTSHVRGRPVTEGAGVEVVRYLGTPDLDYLDPFLLLDEFGSDDPAGYVAGFPPHPHRGFETVTHLLSGRSRHRDSTGSEGVLEAGDVQWMTAGRGILHSEMPEVVDRRLRGFQLWVNLPRPLKLTEPRYQDIPSADIPEITRDGAVIRLIAGELGNVRGAAETHTDVLYFELSLEAGARLELPLESRLNAFLLPYRGTPAVIADVTATPVEAGTLAVLGDGNRLVLDAPGSCSLLLVAGEPLNEPVARDGPFVMNTDEEIRQAYRDYGNGSFGTI